MFADIGHVRETLETRLRDFVPPSWTIQRSLLNPPAEYSKPIITFEFTRLDSTAAGEPLPRGTVAAGIDMILGSPKKTEAGEDDADDLVLKLVHAIDQQPDIYFSTAEKERLDTGQWCWRIHTLVLTNSKE